MAILKMLSRFPLVAGDGLRLHEGQQGRQLLLLYKSSCALGELGDAEPKSRLFSLILKHFAAG